MQPFFWIKSSRKLYFINHISWSSDIFPQSVVQRLCWSLSWCFAAFMFPVTGWERCFNAWRRVTRAFTYLTPRADKGTTSFDKMLFSDCWIAQCYFAERQQPLKGHGGTSGLFFCGESCDTESDRRYWWLRLRCWLLYKWAGNWVFCEVISAHFRL